jgi:hypothetical protein
MTRLRAHLASLCVPYAGANSANSADRLPSSKALQPIGAIGTIGMGTETPGAAALAVPFLLEALPSMALRRLQSAACGFGLMQRRWSRRWAAGAMGYEMTSSVNYFNHLFCKPYTWPPVRRVK